MDNFFQEVYKIVSRIPEGKVTTYGVIGKMLGKPRAARVVGWAMKAVPQGTQIPCHRVVKKTGELAPCHVFGSVEIQRSILESEGITFRRDGTIDMQKHIWLDDF